MFGQKLNSTRDEYLGVLRREPMPVQALVQEARGVLRVPHLASIGPTRPHAVWRHPHREGRRQRHCTVGLQENRLPACGA